MTIESIGAYIDDPSQVAAKQLYEELKQLRFNIKDVDVTSRVFTHWRKFNLIPLMPVGTWVNLDVFQFVWVQIIKDLREFNLPLETIAKVRDELFEVIKFDKTDLLDENGRLKDETKLMLDEEAQQQLEADLKEDETVLDEFFNHFRIPFFVGLVLNVFYRKADHVLLIGSDGRVEIGSEENWAADYAHYQGEFNYKPILVLTLKKYLLHLTSDVKLVSRVEQMSLMNDVELEVLRTMRKGEVKELKIIFDPNGAHTDLVYSFKNRVSEKDLIHVMNQFRGQKHVQLEMKTNDGKSVSYEYQKRKRIKN